jgi:hypothetical protein
VDGVRPLAAGKSPAPIFSGKRAAKKLFRHRAAMLKQWRDNASGSFRLLVSAAAMPSELRRL